MSKRMNQALLNLEAIRQTMHSTGELRLHLKYSRGGTVTCRMWHPDGFKMGGAGGGGYDKRGAAMGEALEKLFTQEELKALPLPRARPNGSQEGLYGLGKGPSGNRYLDGACGYECMIRIVQALGFTDAQLYSTGKDSYMFLARKAAKS